MATPIFYEARTSALQSRILSWYAEKLYYEVEEGPSPNILFPSTGPFDERLGYTRIPLFEERLQERSYSVSGQVRLSPELEKVLRWRLAPPYREPADAGLVVWAAQGTPLFDARPTHLLFKEYDEVPPVVVETLLLIENRELAAPYGPRTNPVVDWPRLAKAGLLYGGNRVGIPLTVQGGSTLATQIEKYRHSPGGRTDSATDKLRQMMSASLKVYRQGPDTRSERRQIVLAYINTVPLAAAPGYGEVHGLGEGLFAWFGLHPNEAIRKITQDGVSPDRARATKSLLALLAAIPAPSYYLLYDREALESRVDFYVQLMEQEGLVDGALASLIRNVPLEFAPRPAPQRSAFPQDKISHSVRAELVHLLGLSDLYELDRLHLEVSTTIDDELQNEALFLFENLKNPEFLRQNGLLEDRLLASGDPSQVVYSLTLFERTPRGNLIRVQADSLDQPFDLSQGMKMELGSTAKLRALVHYLEVVAELFAELSAADDETFAPHAAQARDPITRWAVETLKKNGDTGIATFLKLALERKYSANASEVFFTGGGNHTFQNFDSADNARVMTVREATYSSTNLVFVRLMRDLVRYHEARLPYDPAALLSERDHPRRLKMLERAADQEAVQILSRAYSRYSQQPSGEVLQRLLGNRVGSPRHLAIAFYAWHPEGDERALAGWLERYAGSATPTEVRRLVRAYGNPDLKLEDYGYLLNQHPVEVWCAGRLYREPQLSWMELLGRSGEARQVVARWLLQTRNRRAQDTRLRTLIEQDAFARMTPYWQKTGFPFDRMVPSLASAIGSSSDRPTALAELMGVITNDGLRLPTIRIQELRFAAGTPYETAFGFSGAEEERVIPAEVARAVKEVLNGVVHAGTARRLAKSFVGPDGRQLPIGGKTGSGNNRVVQVNRSGQTVASRPLNRTATFVFYLGDRYFGTITAFVPGKAADQHRFTSALPVTLLRLLEPALKQRLFPGEAAPDRSRSLEVAQAALTAVH